MVLCKPGHLTADWVVYILMAKNAIIFLYSQNVEMIAVLMVVLEALLPFLYPTLNIFVHLKVLSILLIKLITN